MSKATTLYEANHRFNSFMVAEPVVRERVIETIKIGGEFWTVFEDGYAIRGTDAGLHPTRAAAQKAAERRAKKANAERLADLKRKAKFAIGQLTDFRKHLK